jgi:hypothetical protein
MAGYAILLPLAAALLGQVSAPPPTEEALRARISRFYSLQVDGKFREAEAMVAADSRDYYYNSAKSRYFGCEVKDIRFPEITRAKATVVCQVSVMLPGLAGKPVPAPMASWWKQEDGEWRWYIDTGEVKLMPMGGNIDLPGAKQGKAALPRFDSVPTDTAMVLGRVKADRNSVALGARAPVAEVMVANSLPGTVFLSVETPAVDGLEIECPASVRGNGQGTATYRFKPGNEKQPAPVSANILVQPTNEVLPVTIRFE